jgi:carbon storage regulator CsrA
VLIFCRKSGESFRIGDDVVVTVERVRGQRVWLSFQAPAAVRIERLENHGHPEPIEPPIADCPPLADVIRRVLSPAS